MVKDMEHKIGEVITLPDGRKARVKAAKSHLLQCSDCGMWEYFLDTQRDVCHMYKCHKNEREDHTTIYYEEIKEGE